MSTKASLFLTDDNEHCYEETAEPHYDGNIYDPKNFKGYTIVLEMSKKNIRIVDNNEDDLIIEIDPGSELYRFIMKMKR